MNKHFLQSEAWKKFQESLGKTVFEDSGDGWSFLATLESTPLGKYLYLPYGPTIRDKKAFQSALEALEKLAKAQDAIFIRVESTGGVDDSTLSGAGFVKIKEINPEHTWVLDLTASRDDLLADMKQNNRNLFNNYAKKGIQIYHTTDPEKITYLTSLLAGVAKNNHISTHSVDYYKKQMSEANATLYYATLGLTDGITASEDRRQSVTTDGVKQGLRPVTTGALPGVSEEAMTPSDGHEVIAAALVYDSPTTRYYAHAAADYEHRKLSVGTILVAQMIMDAKAKGLKTFDFYGVTASEDPHHPWHGLTKFKKSFGGIPLTYLGDWDLPIKKARYRAFNTLRAINRKVRKTLR